MGVYGKRYGPAYENQEPVPNEWAENEHILKWWTPEYDDVLQQTIQQWRWNWSSMVHEELVRVVPPEVLSQWQKEDRLCKRYAWYNVLMNFAQARAQVQGYDAHISVPKRRPCPLGDHLFSEDSFGMPFVRRLGMDQLDICSPCLEASIFTEGTEHETREPILSYVRGLADVIGRVPPQEYGQGSNDLIDLDTDARCQLLLHMRTKPTLKSVKKHFGTWFDLLIAAELLEDGARKTSRGIQCRANDSHMCHSLGEKTIDDLLFKMGIAHTREPKYPDSNYRGDFEVEGTFIEYFGLAGNAEYDKKSKAKARLAKKHGIPLVVIYPKDLASTKKLKNKLLKVPGFESE